MKRLKINPLLILLSAVHAQVPYHLTIEESPGRLTCVDTREEDGSSSSSSSLKFVQPCPQTGLWELELAEVDEQNKSKFLMLILIVIVIYMSLYCLIITLELFLTLCFFIRWLRMVQNSQR